MQSGTSSVNNRPNGWPIKLGERDERCRETTRQTREEIERSSRGPERRTTDSGGRKASPAPHHDAPPSLPSGHSDRHISCMHRARRTLPSASVRPSLPPPPDRVLFLVYTTCSLPPPTPSPAPPPVPPTKCRPSLRYLVIPHTLIVVRAISRSARRRRHRTERATLARPPRATEAKRLLTG